MPGPVIKKSTTFREAVPRPLHGLYDFFADDPLGGLSPVPLTAAAKAPASLVGALRGLHKSIPLGKEAAEEAVELSKAAQSVEPFAQRLAASSRVTPSRLGHREQLQVPKFAEGILEFGPGPTPYPSRPQPLVEKFLAQRTFEEGAGLSPFTRKSTSPLGEKSRLGATISRELKLGIKTPATRGVSELPEVAGAAREASSGAKPLIGRWTSGKRSAIGKGKLSEGVVRAIRKEAAGGKLSPERIQDLAKEHGVSDTVISSAAQGLSYTWVK